MQLSDHHDVFIKTNKDKLIKSSSSFRVKKWNKNFLFMEVTQLANYRDN